MPTNLTGSNAWSNVPAPNDGEARVASSVRNGMQALADRSEYLRTRVVTIDPTGQGARRVRSVASIAALKAIAAGDLGDGQLARVRRFGLYEFEAAATDASNDRLIVRPSYLPSDAYPGRWVHEHASTLGAAYWMAKLGSDGKVATADINPSGLVTEMQAAGFFNDFNAILTRLQAALHVKNVIQSVKSGHLTTAQSVALGGSVTKVDGYVSSVSMALGDVAVLDFFAQTDGSSTGHSDLKARLHWDNGTDSGYLGSAWIEAVSASHTPAVALHAEFTAPSDGVYEFAGYGQPNPTTNSIAIVASSTRVLVYRP